MATRNSGYARKAADLYETPAWVTKALLDRVVFSPRVWEPAAGGHKIADVFREAGHTVYTSDLHQYDKRNDDTGNFLLEPMLPGEGVWAIVTNPPFGQGNRLAVAFIEHALRLTEKCRGQVAMLLAVDFDSAKGRRHLFDRHPAFAGRLALLDRIRWIEGSTGSPSANFAWFLWDWRNDGKRPVVLYAANETKRERINGALPGQMNFFDETVVA